MAEGTDALGQCGPPYPDVLDVCGDTNDGVKFNILTKQWTDVHCFKFPQRRIGSSMRKLQPHWFVNNTWLRYSRSKDSVFCGPCRFFGPQSSESRDRTFGSTPITDWSNLGKLVTRHINLPSHQNSLLSAEKFITITEGNDKNILQQLSDGYDNIVVKNRQILKCIIETVILCGNQGLPLRGHVDDDGNFARLLKYRSRDNELLRDHLSKCDSTKKYTSPTIQNEIIQICGELIVADIVRACDSAPCYGFMADEATDCSTIEQMALCVRFFDVVEGRIREEFLGFAECGATTGEALTEAFLHNLAAKGIDIQKMRGQGYDGAANMSGKHRGVQARVKEIVPGAVYTHCKAHNLNLAIIHACKEPLVRNIMDIIQTIAFAFDYSAKRLVAYKDTLAEDETARAQMENRHKLKTLCETRWASRADALFTFKAAFTTVYSALGTLAGDGDAKARSYQCAISKFDFIITLVTTEHVLSGLVQLSALLQKKDCDLSVALEEARVVMRVIQNERKNPMVWDALFQSATEIASSIDVQPAFPRIAQAQKHRPNIPATDASTYWRLNMYMPFVDHLLSEIDVRLITAEPRYCAQCLLPSKVGDITNELIDNVYENYKADLTVTKTTFDREVQRWKVRWSTVDKLAGDRPSTLQEALVATPTDLYPSIYMILCVFGCMPVATATAERSFSVMRRVKTYLRNTMATERLSGLGILNVYRDIELDSVKVLDEFTRKKSRKLALIFDY